MKALLLGGAGAICAWAARDMAGHDGFGQITVADLDRQRAELLAGELAREVDVAQVDALDIRTLTDLCRSYDVVINGLPWPLAPNLARVAIAARVPAVDLDGASPELRELAGEAEKARMAYVSGCRTAPGITERRSRHEGSYREKASNVRQWAIGRRP
jgi:saccharopine dehydrogenase-like NADP-dependent oxidoreductase